MHEYALTTLNIIEYARIHLKKQGADYAKSLNESDAVHSLKPLYQLLNSY